MNAQTNPDNVVDDVSSDQEDLQLWAEFVSECETIVKETNARYDSEEFIGRLAWK